jgi:ankyrin repeat protein
VDVLIANGADVACEGGFGGTALIAAACRGHIGIVSKLLQESMSNNTLNLKFKQWCTALEAAALLGHEQVVEVLLQAGADYGKAIEKASKQGHEGVVHVLTKYGAARERVGEVDESSTTRNG